MTDPDWKEIAREAINRLKSAERALGDPQHPRWSDRSPDPKPEGYRTARERVEAAVALIDPYQPALDELPVNFTDEQWDAVYYLLPRNMAEDIFEREAEQRLLARADRKVPE